LVGVQTQVAVAVLQQKLEAVLRQRPGLSTAEAIQRAISLFGAKPYDKDSNPIDVYGQKVNDCAKSLENGDFAGAQRAIGEWRSWYNENK